MRRPAKDGKAQRDHLRAAARTGHPLAVRKLEGPPFPEALEYLWGWYGELEVARGAGMSGPAPITYLDLFAWTQLTGRVVLPHEVDAILKVDMVMRAEYLSPTSDEEEGDGD